MVSVGLGRWEEWEEEMVSVGLGRLNPQRLRWPSGLVVSRRSGLEIKIGEHLTFGSDRGVPEGREARGHGGGGGQYPVG